MSDTADPVCIRFERVTKRYGGVVAVGDIDLQVRRGTLLTLLGPSGCGKTTILRLIAGLERPDGGTISIDGRDVTTSAAHERNVAMVFQSYALFPHMSVLENVGYGLTVGGVARDATRERAQAAMATVGLQGLESRMPSELSGGQQQRVAVARAIVLEPAVLALDEPLSNLDARLRRQMREDIRELQQRLALTVVYVTHDQAEAMAVSDQIVVMNKAAIAQQGTPRQLYREPASVFVASFMGDANRLRARLRHVDERVGELDLAGLRLVLPHRGAAAGEVDVFVRPEAIGIAAAKTSAPASDPVPASSSDSAPVSASSGREVSTLPATVRKAAYLGATVEYSVASALGECFVVAPAGERIFAAGDEVLLTIRPYGVFVVPDPAGR